MCVCVGVRAARRCPITEIDGPAFTVSRFVARLHPLLKCIKRTENMCVFRLLVLELQHPKSGHLNNKSVDLKLISWTFSYSYMCHVTFVQSRKSLQIPQNKHFEISNSYLDLYINLIASTDLQCSPTSLPSYGNNSDHWRVFREEWHSDIFYCESQRKEITLAWAKQHFGEARNGCCEFCEILNWANNWAY